jgi:hypothetical protein
MSGVWGWTRTSSKNLKQKIKIKIMQELPITKLERPDQHIKVQINSLSADLKNKVKIAVQEVVTKIKEKHL